MEGSTSPMKGGKRRSNQRLEAMSEKKAKSERPQRSTRKSLDDGAIKNVLKPKVEHENPSSEKDVEHEVVPFKRPETLPTIVPVWQTETNGASADQSTASTSSNHHSFPLTSTSTSTSSRMPSPPPSFSLSSGQPLVGPPPKTQTAFVGKLYSMLEDPEILKTGLIHWSHDGTCFSCPNPTEFSKVVLPQFFKHNNWQSFVRQLNMYSFNKTGTTDPMAWEFRHPLFRRDQPHRLTQIKRKATRAGQHEPISPIEEDLPFPKPVAGWMRDSAGPSFRITSPNRDLRSAGRTDKSSRYWNDDRPFGMNQTLSHPVSQSVATPSRYNLSSGYPESPYYPQPTPPPEVQSLSNQIATLEDRVERLTSTLTSERIEHVRSNMELTQNMVQISTWVVGGRGTPEMRVMQEQLSRQASDLRQKYERLVASDALTSLAGGTGPERRPRSAYSHSYPNTSIPPPHTLHDPRPSNRHAHAQAPYFRRSPSASAYSSSHSNFHRPSQSGSSRDRPSTMPMVGTASRDQPSNSFSTFTTNAATVETPPEVNGRDGRVEVENGVAVREEEVKVKGGLSSLLN